MFTRSTGDSRKHYPELVQDSSTTTINRATRPNRKGSSTAKTGGKFDVIRAIRIDQAVGEAGPQPNLVFLPTSWLSRRSFKLETSRPSIGSKETRRENNLTSLPISIDSVVNNPVDRAKFFQGISVVLSHVSTTNARNFVLVRVELVY